MTAFEAVGRGSIPKWGTLIVVCPWSVVDARDSAKVEDRVRLPARALNDADVTRRSGGLQSRIQWVRLPPAFLWID